MTYTIYTRLYIYIYTLGFGSTLPNVQRLFGDFLAQSGLAQYCFVVTWG